MKKQLAIVLARDVETSMKILAIAIEEENTYLILKTLANAENELAGIRRLLEKKTVERPADPAKKMVDNHNSPAQPTQEENRSSPALTRLNFPATIQEP